MGIASESCVGGERGWGERDAMEDEVLYGWEMGGRVCVCVSLCVCEWVRERQGGEKSVSPSSLCALFIYPTLLSLLLYFSVFDFMKSRERLFRPAYHLCLIFLTADFLPHHSLYHLLGLYWQMLVFVNIDDVWGKWRTKFCCSSCSWAVFLDVVTMSGVDAEPNSAVHHVYQQCS